MGGGTKFQIPVALTSAPTLVTLVDLPSLSTIVAVSSWPESKAGELRVMQLTNPRRHGANLDMNTSHGAPRTWHESSAAGKATPFGIGSSSEARAARA